MKLLSGEVAHAGRPTRREYAFKVKTKKKKKRKEEDDEPPTPRRVCEGEGERPSFEAATLYHKWILLMLTP